jgi:hypothetical protein
MKKLLISAGLVAVGTANIQPAMADDSGGIQSPPSTSKIWSAGATLRGFYDSNYAVESTGPNKGSYGIELSPTVSLNDSLQQTDFGIRYTYGLYWYNQRQIMGENAFDQTHEVDLWLDHAFDERWKANVSDTFVSGQEPELLNSGATPGAPAVPFRVEGNNIANHANFNLDTQWTRELSTMAHYENDFYDFQNSGGNAADPSLAGLLNRDEQNAGLDLQWHFDPETMAYTGYSFDWVDYVGGEQIGVIPPGEPGALTPYSSDYRNYYAHQMYVGFQHNFTPNLSGNVKAGAQYADNYNQSLPNSEAWSPYVVASVTYTYLPGSYVTLGFSQNNNATYVTTANNGIIQYQESSVVYGSINHHFTEKLIGSALAQMSYSEFHGTSSLGPDVLYSAGLNLTYLINKYFSADAGYNYDRLRSDIPGAGYERNRFYVGVTATY